jgi:hypothetical protein
LLGIPEGGKWFKTVTNFHQNHPHKPPKRH